MTPVEQARPGFSLSAAAGLKRSQTTGPAPIFDPLKNIFLPLKCFEPTLFKFFYLRCFSSPAITQKVIISVETQLRT